jgi:DNA-binding response OmpR family regulator
VLDVKMPGMDGWQTLDRIKEVSNVPVLMLTARSGELDKVRGLRAGADDYVAKPFGHQELLGRTEALLRRAREQADVVDRYGDALITIDFAEGIVTVGGREIALTPTEFKLLATFARHPNQLLSHEQLLELVWDDPYAVSPGAVKLYVGYLRGKLGAGADDGSPIETVRGFGYRYRPPGA